jgi:molybdopterin/thiamine biosynthesis adenylyltransferase
MIMEYSGRYARNYNAFTREEGEKFSQFRVLVVGCGGLGGYIIEHLGRLGIGHITVVDGDCFEETNLNRQLFCTEELLGTPKALAAKARMDQVNREVEVVPLVKRMTEDNVDEILQGHHIAIDALDNIESRFVLEEGCQRAGIPMVHGAIGGWYGQVGVSFPGKPLLPKIYGRDREKGMEEELGNPSFTPGIIAGMQVALCMKVLLNQGEELVGKLLTIDLENMEFISFRLED